MLMDIGEQRGGGREGAPPLRNGFYDPLQNPKIYKVKLLPMGALTPLVVADRSHLLYGPKYKTLIDLILLE